MSGYQGLLNFFALESEQLRSDGMVIPRRYMVPDTQTGIPNTRQNGTAVQARGLFVEYLPSYLGIEYLAGMHEEHMYPIIGRHYDPSR